MPETYERLRGSLAALADDAWLLAMIADASIGASPTSGRRWKRVYERFEPGRKPFATLVLESRDEPQTLGLLEVFADRPCQVQDAIHERTVGWIRLRPFWSDEGLPSLAAVLERPGKRRVLRYRPHRRCTIRFEAGARRLFAKVFPDDRGSRLHAESVALWEAGARGELGFRVARPVRWDGALRTLWHEELEGEPVADRLRSAGGPELGERIGAALASLNRAALAPVARFDEEAQLERTRRRGAELCLQVPRLRLLIEDTLRKLARLYRQASRRPPRPIHGAPHVHQWLDDGQRLGLIDFDRFCLGDAELDVATVLAAMDFEDRARVPVDEINRRLLAGYESAGGILDPRRLLAHRVHQRIGKALKSLRTPRSDADRRAERRWDDAAALLESVRA